MFLLFEHFLVKQIRTFAGIKQSLSYIRAFFEASFIYIWVQQEEESALAGPVALEPFHDILSSIDWKSKDPRDVTIVSLF